MLLLTSNSPMLAAILGGWELALIVAVVFILYGAKQPRSRKELDSQAHDAGESLGGIYGKHAAEALTSDNQTAELYDPAVFKDANANGRGRKKSWFRSWFRKWSAFLRLVWRSVLECLKAKG
jgi:hypothetical protein